MLAAPPSRKVSVFYGRPRAFNENASPSRARQGRAWSTTLPSLAERGSSEASNEPSLNKPLPQPLRKVTTRPRLDLPHLNERSGNTSPAEHQNHGGIYPASEKRHPPLEAGGIQEPTSQEKKARKKKKKDELGDILTMIRDGFHLGPTADTQVEDRLSRVRSTSSDYDAQNSAMSRVASPDVPLGEGNLTLIDFSKYGETNDCLSNLASSTSSSETRAEKTPAEALQEAAVTINEWQSEPRADPPPYNEHGREDAAEILPSESLSQRGRLQLPSDKVHVKKRPAFKSYAKEDGHVKFQFDGGSDTRYRDSPVGTPPQMACKGPRASKRTASHFSIRSLSNPFKFSTKKPRLGVRKFTNAVLREASFSEARKKLANQKKTEMRGFAAWKAYRRRCRPGDPIKGKPEKGLVAFSLDRALYGGEKWWEENVCRYQAPSWMHFGN